MNFTVVISFLKAILPTKKIGAYILGVLGALLALFLGVSNPDIKAAYCAADVVNIPALPDTAPVPAPVPAASPAAKPVEAK
jgi:hypothetical protein